MLFQAFPFFQLHGDNQSYVHTVKLKPIIKAQISGKLVTSDISDVAFALYSEKTRLKKLIMIIIITEKPFTSK